MTGPFSALAVAVLLWPAPARCRLGVRRGAAHRRGAVRPAAAVVAMLAAMLAPLPVLAASAVAAGTAVLRWRRHRRCRDDLAAGRALAGALDVLVGELRVGSGPAAAFSAAAAETSSPAVASGLGVVAARAALGADVAAGLRGVTGSRALAPYWERVAVCWQLASRHGLPVAALMRAAQRDIAERHQFAARVSAAMAGPRATAAILAGLPVMGLALGELIGASPLRVLTGSAAGGFLLVVGVALACAGLLWSDRIVAGVTR